MISKVLVSNIPHFFYFLRRHTLPIQREHEGISAGVKRPGVSIMRARSPGACACME